MDINPIFALENQKNTDMKSRNIITACLVCLMLVLCNMSAEAKDKVIVQRGMTKQQVTAILGKPENTSFDQYGEQWEYYKNGWPLNWDRRIVVGFDNSGRVATYHSTYLRPDKEVQKVQVEKVPQPVEVPVPAYRGDVYCMSDQDFSTLYNKVKGASFDSNKFDLIEVANLGCYYNCSQCAKIMSMFSFDDKKLKALQMMGRHIVDPQNANQIYRLFDFESGREKAAAIIGNR